MKLSARRRLSPPARLLVNLTSARRFFLGNLDSARTVAQIDRRQRRHLVKTLARALVAGLFVCCSAAFAGDIDLSAWTCQKFQSANKDDVGVILTWLDGYYRGDDDPPVIDTDKLAANAKKLGEFCAAHPDVGLITATDKVFRPQE
jgi:acid stress chaperone HdeB